jgi:hypothetical protein
MTTGKSTTQDRQFPGVSSIRLQDFRMSACLSDGTPIVTASVQVARLDLQFETDRLLRYGTTLKLALFTEPIRSVCYGQAVVHYCRAGRMGWRIGAFLSQPLPAHLTDRGSEDLRSQLRYDCDWKAWVLWERSGQLSPVHVSSYSINGMRLMLQDAAQPGDQFSLFSSAGTSDRTVIHGKVEWCRAADDKYSAGCSVAGQRGRDLPRMFGNLVALHIDHQEQSQVISTGETLDMLLTQHSDPDRFLNDGAGCSTDSLQPVH